MQLGDIKSRFEQIRQQLPYGDPRNNQVRDWISTLDLIDIHRRSIQIMLGQIKTLGAFAPPYMIDGVNSRRGEIRQLKANFMQQMHEAYLDTITLDDLPGIDYNLPDPESLPGA